MSDTTLHGPSPPGRPLRPLVFPEDWQEVNLYQSLQDRLFALGYLLPIPSPISLQKDLPPPPPGSQPLSPPPTPPLITEARVLRGPILRNKPLPPIRRHSGAKAPSIRRYRRPDLGLGENAGDGAYSRIFWESHLAAKPHLNFLGHVPSIGPICVSVLSDDAASAYIGIVRTPLRFITLHIPYYRLPPSPPSHYLLLRTLFSTYAERLRSHRKRGREWRTRLLERERLHAASADIRQVLERSTMDGETYCPVTEAIRPPSPIIRPVNPSGTSSWDSVIDILEPSDAARAMKRVDHLHLHPILRQLDSRLLVKAIHIDLILGHGHGKTLSGAEEAEAVEGISTLGFGSPLVTDWGESEEEGGKWEPSDIPMSPSQPTSSSSSSPMSSASPSSSFPPTGDHLEDDGMMRPSTSADSVAPPLRALPRGGRGSRRTTWSDARSSDEHSEFSAAMLLRNMPEMTVSVIEEESSLGDTLDVERGKEESLLHDFSLELLETERTLVERLRVIVEIWQPAVRAACKTLKLLEQYAFHRLFYNVADIARLNENLLLAMAPRIGRSNLGSILHRHFILLAGPYELYMQNFDGVQDLLGGLERENPAWADFTRRMNDHPRVRPFHLGDFLAAPVQRMSRYKMLLDGLIQHTPPSASGFPGLVASARVVDRVNCLRVQMRTDQAKMHLDELVHIRDHIEECPNRLVSGSSRLLMQLRVTEIEMASLRQRDPLIFYLLTDRLLIARRAEGKHLRFLALVKVEHVHLLLMDDAGSHTGFYLRITQPPLPAETPPTSRAWLEEPFRAYVAHDKRESQSFCSFLLDAQAKARQTAGLCSTLQRPFDGRTIYTHIYSPEEYARTPLKSPIAIIHSRWIDADPALMVPDTDTALVMGIIQAVHGSQYRFMLRSQVDLAHPLNQRDENGPRTRPVTSDGTYISRYTYPGGARVSTEADSTCRGVEGANLIPSDSLPEVIFPLIMHAQQGIYHSHAHDPIQEVYDAAFMNSLMRASLQGSDTAASRFRRRFKPSFLPRAKPVTKATSPPSPSLPSPGLFPRVRETKLWKRLSHGQGSTPNSGKVEPKASSSTDEPSSPSDEEETAHAGKPPLPATISKSPPSIRQRRSRKQQRLSILHLLRIGGNDTLAPLQ